MPFPKEEDTSGLRLGKAAVTDVLDEAPERAAVLSFWLKGSFLRRAMQIYEWAIGWLFCQRNVLSSWGIYAECDRKAPKTIPTDNYSFLLIHVEINNLARHSLEGTARVEDGSASLFLSKDLSQKEKRILEDNNWLPIMMLTGIAWIFSIIQFPIWSKRWATPHENWVNCIWKAPCKFNPKGFELYYMNSGENKTK